MPSLILITEDYPRQIFQLGRATLMVGRDDTSQIQISDDSVSRNHASIIYDTPHFVIRDNGSTNGSYVNGQRVSRHILRHHDVIRFGSCLFLVDMADKARGPTGTDVLSVTHQGTPKGTVVEISPKPAVAGELPNPIKIILSSKIGKEKGKPLPPLTAR